MMQQIKYKAVFAEGNEVYVRVLARDINSGMRKALARAMEDAAERRAGGCLPGEAELHSIEFWMVVGGAT